MKEVVFPFFGTLLVCFGYMCLGVVFALRQGPDLDKRYFQMLILATVCYVVGFGVMFRRKWAAFFMSLLSLAFAVNIYDAHCHGYVTTGDKLILSPVMTLCACSIAATITRWDELKPGGRYYF